MVTKTIKINAPVKKVFYYITNPDNWTRYVTSLVGVRNISSKSPETGTTFEWTYRMLGINFDGRGTVVEFLRDKKFAIEMDGSFPTRESYLFEGNSDSTMLTIEINYEVHGRILCVLANRLVVEKLNKREADAVLKKVKTICETDNI